MPNDTDSSPERLDSWKDIATYLRRDVSTVQRWEKREGMPVHRHQHEKLGSVYAFRSELDAWSRGRGIDVAQQEADGSVTHELPPPHVAAAVTSRWRLAAAVGALALLIAIAVVIKGSRARGGGTDNHESSATARGGRPRISFLGPGISATAPRTPTTRVQSHSWSRLSSSTRRWHAPMPGSPRRTSRAWRT